MDRGAPAGEPSGREPSSEGGSHEAVEVPMDKHLKHEVGSQLTDDGSFLIQVPSSSQFHQSASEGSDESCSEAEVSHHDAHVHD